MLPENMSWRTRGDRRMGEGEEEDTEEEEWEREVVGGNSRVSVSGSSVEISSHVICQLFSADRSTF